MGANAHDCSRQCRHVVHSRKPSPRCASARPHCCCCASPHHLCSATSGPPPFPARRPHCRPFPRHRRWPAIRRILSSRLPQVSLTFLRSSALSSLLFSRSGLPSEALEEFLSILRPSVSIFPPNSPRRRAPNSLPTWHYERSTFNFKPRARIEAAPPKSETDELDAVRSTQSSRNTLSPAPVAATPEIEGTTDPDVFADAELASFRWFSSGVLCELIRRLSL